MTDGRPTNTVIEPFGFELDNAQRGWARLPAWLLLAVGGGWSLIALISSSASLISLFTGQARTETEDVPPLAWVITSILLTLLCLVPALLGLAIRRKASTQSDSRRFTLLRRFGLIYISASIYSASLFIVYGLLRTGSNPGGTP